MNLPHYETSLAGPARIDIDLAAIADNTRILLRRAAPAELMVVVKADGYGHGAIEVARTALSAGAKSIGVTIAAEAIALREAGVDAPILSWFYGQDQALIAAMAAGVDVAVSSADHLDVVIQAAKISATRPNVTPKLDTGLHRSGISAAQWPHVLSRLVDAHSAGIINVTGLMAHFACADEIGHPETDAQAKRLRVAIAQGRAAGLPLENNHHANSAASLTRPDLGFETVRPGIAVYGLSPVVDDFGLRPAMTFSASVMATKTVPEGAGVSYGHTWVAPQETTVAIIGAGYADGVPRLLSGKFSVLIRGQRFPSVGRVCMDQFVVDIGNNSVGIQPGDQAELFGDGRCGGATAKEWADTIGTIDYEIVSGIRGRTSRHFHHGVTT